MMPNEPEELPQVDKPEIEETTPHPDTRSPSAETPTTVR